MIAPNMPTSFSPDLIRAMEPVARELLVSVVRARLRERTDSPIRLRGDRDASYGDIIGVLDLLASQGLTRIAIMTNTQPVDAAPQRPHD